MNRLTVETADCVLPIRSLSRDLYADIVCRSGGRICEIITISGYNDAYFFDRVNAEDRPPVTCPKCGDQYVYRWTPQGVLLAHVGIDKAATS